MQENIKIKLNYKDLVYPEVVVDSETYLNNRITDIVSFLEDTIMRANVFQSCNGRYPLDFYELKDWEEFIK